MPNLHAGEVIKPGANNFVMWVTSQPQLTLNLLVI